MKERIQMTIAGLFIGAALLLIGLIILGNLLVFVTNPVGAFLFVGVIAALGPWCDRLLGGSGL